MTLAPSPMRIQICGALRLRALECYAAAGLGLGGTELATRQLYQQLLAAT